MKSLRSLTGGARRHRSSPTDKKEGDAAGDRGNLRRSTREQGNSASKSRPRRRSRGLPLTRTRKDDSSETEQEEQVKETVAETTTSTPSKSEDEQKDAKDDEVASKENDKDLEEKGLVISTPKMKKSGRGSTLSRERMLTAVGENGELISVNIVVGGQSMKSRRLLQQKKDGGNGAATQAAKKETFLGNDGNLFYCYVCHGFGDVVCCDGCPHVYHQNCLKLGSASRRSLDNDDDPWYCPNCIPNQLKSSCPETRSEASERRVIKHRCCECQSSRSDIPLEPCEGCGSYLHHPSCRIESEFDSPPSVANSSILCSSCRAELALNQEEDEIREREKKKRKLDSHSELNHDLAEETLEESEHDPATSSRRRTRSMDEDHDAASVEFPVEEDPEHFGEEGGEQSNSKRKRNDRDRDHDRDRRSVSPPRRSAEKKKKKKKKEKEREKDREMEKGRDREKGHEGRNELGHKDSATLSNNDSHALDEPANFPYKPRPLQGLATATPAFFFYLAENRYKIERVLARKHRYFNRLPKGIDRNELVAREAALWWIKLRPTDHRRYMNMSMRDYEQRIIEWKEEKSIRDMLMARESDDEEDIIENENTDVAPDDDYLTYELHERLYLGTSVGSKPYKPEPDQSHNRVLLDLLRDMRFHPLPMFSVTRTDTDFGPTDNNSSKVTIPHFDVHGPFSTSVGDECLGCTRGWAHFCPVLKRRLPAVEHRAKLQPPLSSLLATRIGLGLRPHLERIENDDKPKSNSMKDDDLPLFEFRDNDESAELNKLPFVPCSTLTDPSSRADDIVQFIEEAVAMKVAEPPRPTKPGSTQATSKKSGLSRGRALPTSSRKRPFDLALSESNETNWEEHVNKCGRCRTIIKTDTGCIQCRRAQLVINMSKRQPSSAPASSDHRSQKSDSKGGGGSLLKVQTAMLGRVMMKDSSGETQSEGDLAIAAGILKERWNPCAILPSERALAPSPSRRSNPPDSDDSDDSSDAEEESQDESDTVAEESANKPGVSIYGTRSSAGLKDAEGSTRETELRPRPAVRTGYGVAETLDRELIAKKCKEEASELHKKALSVAISGILLALRRRDPLLLFANPVTAEGYEKVVKSPIDFGKIRSNVLAGSYQTLGAFVSDARRLCDNALAFNPPGSIYWKTAKELYDVLAVMQKRASRWMTAIRDAHARAWRRAPRKKRQDHDNDAMEDDFSSVDISPEDPFEKLRQTWPEAVDMLENSDWLKNQLAADFMRTKENETAYYGSLAVRRVAAAADVCLAPYTDTNGIYSIVTKRSCNEDEALRRMVDDRASKIVDPVQLKDISSWREEGIVRLMRRVQSRRLERRIGSENGCARCDGIGLDQESKVAMNADRFGRNKKKGEADNMARVDNSRLELTTGLASAKTREQIEARRNQSKDEVYGSVNDACVSLRGSRIHGWGLFAEQAFKKGDLVAEYVGEYVTPPVADLREKIYQEQRIQDYQFRLDDSLVIDATMNGGHGRYINHNCNPNCMTKIVPGKPPNENLKRVLVFSMRDIEPREELTYDYQFPLELDLGARIPCNCESEICRGFMNWDLPEKGSNSHALRTQKRGANMRDRIRRLGRPLKK